MHTIFDAIIDLSYICIVVALYNPSVAFLAVVRVGDFGGASYVEKRRASLYLNPTLELMDIGPHYGTKMYHSTNQERSLLMKCCCIDGVSCF